MDKDWVMSRHHGKWFQFCYAAYKLYLRSCNGVTHKSLFVLKEHSTNFILSKCWLFFCFENWSMKVHWAVSQWINFVFQNTRHSLTGPTPEYRLKEKYYLRKIEINDLDDTEGKKNLMMSIPGSMVCLHDPFGLMRVVKKTENNRGDGKSNRGDVLIFVFLMLVNWAIRVQRSRRIYQRKMSK